MLKRKISEFSLLSTYNFEDRDEISDTDNIFSKKKNIKDEAIKTFCRIRKIDNNPGLYKISEIENRTLIVKLDDPLGFKMQNSSTNFTFTKIFDSNIGSFEIFDDTCKPLITDLFQSRKSGLIFSYGLTNAGKTYTVIGNPTSPGLLPITMKYLMNYAQESEEVPEIYANYIEVYNEEIYDLLASDGKSNKCKKKLCIKEKDKVFYIQGVTDKMIRNIEDFNEALNLGIMKKTHASTTLNSYSSRSHTIFKFIMRWSRGDCYEEASLSLVDLAGSERAYRAETSGKELQQACKINHSLYVLGKCMEIMKHNSIYSNKKIVPFRESKLTMLFQEYFQGDQNIIMVTNINPSKDDLNETLRVLSYSCTARDIKPIKSKLVSNYTYKPIKQGANSSMMSNENILQEEDDKQSLKFSNIEENKISMLSIEKNQYPNIKGEVENLKYQFMHISKRYQDQLEKHEELERKNAFLLSKYTELQFQFKLRELDLKTNLIESISNDIFNRKFENIISALDTSRYLCFYNRSENKRRNSVVINNPFYCWKNNMDSGKICDEEYQRVGSMAVKCSRSIHMKDSSSKNDLIPSEKEYSFEDSRDDHKEDFMTSMNKTSSPLDEKEKTVSPIKTKNKTKKCKNTEKSFAEKETTMESFSKIDDSEEEDTIHKLPKNTKKKNAKKRKTSKNKNKIKESESEAEPSDREDERAEEPKVKKQKSKKVNKSKKPKKSKKK